VVAMDNIESKQVKDSAVIKRGSKVALKVRKLEYKMDFGIVVVSVKLGLN
jgi:hypothetical protein